MATYTITAQGLPKAQPRARAVSFAGRARMYNPETAKDWKGDIRRAVVEAGLANKRLAGPLFLSVSFELPRPKKHFKGNDFAKPKRADAPKYVCAKPDLDNAEKALMDALTNAGVWLDDAQVVKKHTQKVYGDFFTGAQITIREIEEGGGHGQ